MATKKPEDLSPAERDLLSKKAVKAKIKEEKVAIDTKFSTAVADETLTAYKGITPTEYRNTVNNITTGTFWRDLKRLSKVRNSLIDSQNIDIANYKNTAIANRTARGAADLVDIQNLINYYVTNISESIFNKTIENDINIITNERMRLYGNTKDILNKKIPINRMSSGWSYKSSYNISKDQSIPKVLGHILMENDGMSGTILEDILSKGGKGTVNISEALASFKPQRKVMKELVDSVYRTNLIAGLVMNVANEINTFNGIKGINNLPTSKVIDDALDRILVKVMAGSTNAPDSVIKEGLIDLINDSRTFIEGLEGQFNSRSIIEHQQRVLSVQFSDIIDSAHKPILSLQGIQEKNLVRSIMTDRYGFPTEEPVLNSNNTISKRYYGNSYENIIKGEYFKSEELQAIINDLDDRIEEARGVNRQFNINKDLPTLTTDKKKFLSPEESAKIMEHVRTNKNVTPKARVAFEISNSAFPRINELRNIRIRDLEKLDDNKIWIGTGKKRANRYIFLTQDAGHVKRALKEYLKTHPAPTNPDAYLFPSPSDVLKPQSSLDVIFKDVKATTGIEVRSHMFRHTNTTRLLTEGVTPSVAMETLGHRTMAEVPTYAHVMRPEDLIVKDTFILDRNGIIVDIHASNRSLEDVLKDIRNQYIEAREELINANKDYKISTDTVRIHRQGSNIFEYSVHPNLDIDIKNIEIDETQIEPAKSVSQTKKKLKDPFARTTQIKSGAPTAIMIQITTADRDTREALNNIAFHAFAPQSTDDVIEYLANPDNISYNPEFKKYERTVYISQDVNTTHTILNTPHKDMSTIINDKTLITNPEVDISKIELPKDVAPRGEDGKKINTRRLTPAQRKALWKNSRRLTAGAVILNSLFDFVGRGKAIAKGITQGIPFFSKKAAREGAELGTDVAIEWGLYDDAAWGNFILRNEYSSEKGVYIPERINIHDPIKIGGILDMPVAQSTKEIYGQLDLMSADDIFSFLTQFDVEKQVGVPTEESRWGVAEAISQTIGPYAPPHNMPDARDEYYKNKAALQKGFLAKDYVTAKEGYLEDLEKRVQGITSDESETLEEPVSEEWNYKEGYDRSQLEWRRNMARNRADYAVSPLRQEKTQADKDRLSKIKELYAQKDLKATNNMDAQLDNLLLNTNQPQGEENATTR